MGLINKFREIRRDGRVLDENMTLEKMISLGWNPDQIIAVEWEHENRKVDFNFRNGVLSQLLPSKDAVALLSDGGMSLSVVNADGTERFRVPNAQVISGQGVVGVFRWFEPPRSNLQSCFAVVFESSGDGTFYLLEIDPITGHLLGVHETR